jgi:hypothetical protein
MRHIKKFQLFCVIVGTSAASRNYQNYKSTEKEMHAVIGVQYYRVLYKCFLQVSSEEGKSIFGSVNPDYF